MKSFTLDSKTQDVDIFCKKRLTAKQAEYGE